MWMVLLLIVVALFSSTASSAREGMSPESITVIYDNYPYTKGLKTGWGFSCVVRGGDKTVLFDTGGDGHVLLANMRELSIDPQEIELVVLSHIHGDHVGGLASLLQQHHAVTVFVPPSFPADFKEGVRGTGALLREVDGFTELCRDVYSTGEMGHWIKEQALILRTPRGLIVITGCAHPGVVQVVEAIKAHFNEHILLVMGGFHLKGEGTREIQRIVARFQELGVKNIGPCHCSGDVARGVFQKAYGKAFMPIGVGMEIRIDELQ